MLIMLKVHTQLLSHTERQGKLANAVRKLAKCSQVSRCESEGSVPMRKKTKNMKDKWEPLLHLLARPDRNIGHVQRYKGKRVEK